MSLDTKEDHISEPILSLPLEEYSATLHRMTDLDEAVQFALDSILAIVEAHSGSLFLWDESAKEFIARAVRTPSGSARLRDIRIRLREGIAGKVAEKGHSVLVTDIQQDHRFSDIPRSGRYNSSSFICLPLTIDHKLIGVINITEKESLLPFDREDSKMAELFSKHIASACENIRIRQHLREENLALHSRVHELTEKMKQQDSFASTGKLASHLAHELNNPLDAIRRFVNLALDESLEDSLTREYLLKAKKGIRRAVNVIRGLLQFSRTSVDSSFRTSEIHEVIEQSIESVSHNHHFEKIVFQKNFPDGSLFVPDGGLQLVFKNLFENSAYAMNGDGSQPKGKVMLTTRQEGDAVLIQIQDSGRGIPEHVKSRIFEPFFTTKPGGEGTGIGLAISKEIVERSGGKISVEHAQDDQQGALFQIVLPCVSRAD